MFEKYGFQDVNTVAITEYKGDIVIVPCEDCMSGIYPDYKKSQPIITGWIDSFSLLNRLEDSDTAIEAIIFQKETNGYEIFFATNTHDGFQFITD